MSNILLGNVYNQIMERVIEDCQTTFEEDGVNHQTLEDLRTTWQKKLTELKVGSFPWDPPPPPQPMPNPTLPSNMPRPMSGPAPAGSAPASSATSGVVHIKSEPGYEGPAIPNLPPNYVHNEARERAMANLQDKFGSNASAQITQLQNQMVMSQPVGQQTANGSAQAPTHQSTPAQPQQAALTAEQQRERHLEYQRRQHAAQYQQMQASQSQSQNQPQSSSSSSQPQSQPHSHAQAQSQPSKTAQSQPMATIANTDGADDWAAYVADRRLQAAASGPDGDLSLRDRVQQMSRSLEGGGLMLPLDEQPRLPKSRRRAITQIRKDQSSTRGEHLVKVMQMDGEDGGDDDDDEDDKEHIKDELFDDGDEDAINSDLDDPADNEIEEEQEEGKPTQVMLCTYDKVQRVKNKWKCTLRDGVLNSNGKEYVFGKASGEFEW